MRAWERYLTPQERDAELDHWMEALLVPRPAGDLAGLGYVDPEMVPLVDTLNALDPGICTLQSCAGHPGTATRGVFAGFLWLRLDKEMSSIFDANVDALVSRIEIRWARKHYAVDLPQSLPTEYRRVREIVDIGFYGAELGQLELSLPVIAGFFSELVELRDQVADELAALGAGRG